MLQSIRKRLSRDEGGFTLIELMVVVLIIAILIAIAVPTFLGARQRAQNRAAQTDLKNGYTNAKVIYSDAETFSDTDANLKAALTAAEPSLTFVAGAMPDPYTGTDVYVQVSAAAHQGFLAVRRSSSGNYYGIAATSGGTVTRCNGTNAVATAWTIADAATTCTNGW
jgi:type IV pilus assembly protein PilA